MGNRSAHWLDCACKTVDLQHSREDEDLHGIRTGCDRTEWMDMELADLERLHKKLVHELKQSHARASSLPIWPEWLSMSNHSRAFETMERHLRPLHTRGLLLKLMEVDSKHERKTREATLSRADSGVAGPASPASTAAPASLGSPRSPAAVAAPASPEAVSHDRSISGEVWDDAVEAWDGAVGCVDHCQDQMCAMLPCCRKEQHAEALRTVAARQCCRTKQRTKRGTNGHADTKLEDIEKTQFPLLARQLQIKIP